MRRSNTRGRREGVLLALRRIRKPLAILSLAMTLVWLVPLKSEAAVGFTAPLGEDGNGNATCTTCVTESSPTQYGVVVQSSTQETGVVGPDASTTKPLFSAGSSANPTFRDIAITDLPTGMKTGGANAGAGAKVVTSASGGSTTAGKMVQYDANGNLEASSYDVGAVGSIVPKIDVSPITKMTIASGTTYYCGLDGSCSITANGADVQTRLNGTGTFGGLECDTAEGTTNAVTVVVGLAATCGSTVNTTTKAQNIMSASAWTRGTASGSTAYTDGQCVVLVLTAGTSATKATFRCSVKQTAGT